MYVVFHEKMFCTSSEVHYVLHVLWVRILTGFSMLLVLFTACFGARCYHVSPFILIYTHMSLYDNYFRYR